MWANRSRSVAAGIATRATDAITGLRNNKRSSSDGVYFYNAAGQVNYAILGKYNRYTSGGHAPHIMQLDINGNYTSVEGDTAGHMVGSSTLKPMRKNAKSNKSEYYKSFKYQWVKETGCEWPSKCSTKGCDNKATVGAHVCVCGKIRIHRSIVQIV